MKTFCGNQSINLCGCGKSLTSDIRLRKDSAKKTIGITCKTDDAHDCFRKQIVVQCDGF